MTRTATKPAASAAFDMPKVEHQIAVVWDKLADHKTGRTEWVADRHGRIITIYRQMPTIKSNWRLQDSQGEDQLFDSIMGAKAEGRRRLLATPAPRQATPVQEPQSQATGAGAKAPAKPAGTRTRSTRTTTPKAPASAAKSTAAHVVPKGATAKAPAPKPAAPAKAPSTKGSAEAGAVSAAVRAHMAKLAEQAPARKTAKPKAEGAVSRTARAVHSDPVVGVSGRTDADLKAVLAELAEAKAADKPALRAQRDVLLAELMAAENAVPMAELVRRVSSKTDAPRAEIVWSTLTTAMQRRGEALLAESAKGAAKTK